MKLAHLFLSAIVMLPAACAQRDGARVDCGTPGPHGVDCRVARTSGDGDFKACWDLVITCRNGAAMTGAGCHTMSASLSEGIANLPVTSFTDQASCDTPSAGQVKRLKIVSG